MRGVSEAEFEMRGIEFWSGKTDLFPRIGLWVCYGLSFDCLGWAKGPGVSKPSSRLGCVVNKGGSAAASDGAHLVVSRQRSFPRFGLTAIDHLRPLAVIVTPS